LIKTIDNTIGLNEKLKKQDLDYYDPCFISKFQQKGNKTLISRVPNLIVFDIDIAGSFKSLGPKGKAYFLTITDRGSRCI
jgi:hypothetical protein